MAEHLSPQDWISPRDPILVAIMDWFPQPKLRRGLVARAFDALWLWVAGLVLPADLLTFGDVLDD